MSKKANFGRNIYSPGNENHIRSVIVKNGIHYYILIERKCCERIHIPEAIELYDRQYGHK